MRGNFQLYEGPVAQRIPELEPGTQGYNYGFGSCVACEKQVLRTIYWTSPNIVYRVGKVVHGGLFTLGHNKPFCGTDCAMKYHLKTNQKGE